jgi:hypothetical protein
MLDRLPARVRVLRRARVAVAFATAAALFSIASPALAAPAPAFPLHPGQHGPRVAALQWVLAGHKPAAYRYGFYKGKVDGRFGPSTAAALKATKWRLGYPTNAAKQPVANQLFFLVIEHKVQRPLAWRLAAGRRANRATSFKPAAPTGPARILIRDADFLIAHAQLVHYTQGGARMTIVRDRLQLPPLARAISEDCSSSTTGLYWLAKLPDPNGLGYSGQGYTGTEAEHGRVVWRLGDSLALLKPGDLIFYGRFPHSHVTMYLGNGRVFSHGSEGGPYDLPALYRGDAVYARRYFS